MLVQARSNPTMTQRQIDFGRLTATYLPRYLNQPQRPVASRWLKKRFKRFLDHGPSATSIANHCRSGSQALNARYGDQLARFGYTL